MGTQGTDRTEARRERYRAAELLARIAGDNVAKWYTRSFSVDYKADATPVTDADRDTETLMRELLELWYPDDGIVGEEHGTRDGSSGFTWYLDPIDGTKSFVAGVPLFTVLVGVSDHEAERGRGEESTGAPVIGVIRNPITDETVSALVGYGARYNGRITYMRPAVKLRNATVLMCDPADLYTRRRSYAETFFSSAGMVRTWADAYAYLLLASGRADLAVDPVMSPWDIAPIGPIITEAGGVFERFDGGEDWLADSCIASRRELLDEVRGLLAG
ncbi:MAG: inositol monophosphatase family protein [Spirochaetaceae bacterium]